MTSAAELLAIALALLVGYLVGRFTS